MSIHFAGTMLIENEAEKVVQRADQVPLRAEAMALLEYLLSDIEADPPATLRQLSGIPCIWLRDGSLAAPTLRELQPLAAAAHTPSSDADAPERPILLLKPQEIVLLQDCDLPQVALVKYPEVCLCLYFQIAEALPLESFEKLVARICLRVEIVP